MVRIYLEKQDSSEKDKEKYVDIYYWSLVKAYFLAWLGIMGIIIGVWLLLFLVIMITGY